MKSKFTKTFSSKTIPMLGRHLALVNKTLRTWIKHDFHSYSQNIKCKSQLNLNNTLLVYNFCFILLCSSFMVYTWHESTKNVHIHIHGSVLGRRYHWSQKLFQTVYIKNEDILSFSFPFRLLMTLTSNKNFWWCWFSDNI